MTQSKHTPTPWVYRRAYANGEETGFCVGRPCDPVCDLTGFDEISEANAAFIIKAVNSHEELILAIRSVISAHTTGDFYDRGRKVHDLIDQLTNALINADAIPNAAECYAAAKGAA